MRLFCGYLHVCIFFTVAEPGTKLRGTDVGAFYEAERCVGALGAFNKLSVIFTVVFCSSLTGIIAYSNHFVK